MKRILIALVILLFIAVGIFFFKKNSTILPSKNIEPTKTQNNASTPSYTNEIKVETPKPNQKVTSPLRIAGEARGSWFFEATAPVELFDGNNVSLGMGIIQAQGEWMTEEFVPFEGKIIFNKPGTDKGTLIIKNANPSGLSENEKQISIPVEF